MFLPITASRINAGTADTVQVNTPPDGAVVTTKSLTTAAGATYTLTVNSPVITSNSIVLVALRNGTNNAGDPVVGLVTPADSGSCTIAIVNRHASAALNGTLVVSFVVVN